ncbi:MAG: hypothetical protein ACOX2G_07160 [Bacillota bacterium]
MTKSFGYGPKGGDRVMIAVPDVVGRLADITGLMKKNDISIETIISTQSRFAYTVMVIMKVEKGKGPEAKRLLERNGFKLIKPGISESNSAQGVPSALLMAFWLNPFHKITKIPQGKR